MQHSIWRVPRSGPPRVIAHRAGALLAVENSAEAFHLAAKAGADAVETDLRLTADGVLVCLHDADLGRLAGDPRQVADLDLATIRQLVPHVLTLAEAMAASAPLGLLLDVKLTQPDCLAPILAAVEAGGATERILLGLRHPALIAEAHALAPAVPVLAFLADPDAVAAARQAGAAWFRLWEGTATPARVAAARAEGLGVAIMTGQPRSTPLPGEWPPFPTGHVDTPGLAALTALGPDAILLDDPRLARSP
ncbi:glycerophosphodiester phosphodiesterase [Chelatococcus sp. GCM10030263]|uniref:glycerophosphodiester phosphodiesterase n=1 Tax=Chelatococcus sp. GCM10030263 TaxID=3273387 RepID=UPI003606581E